MFRKILIANRGEIAVRILRTCRAMGISTVAVYSDADREGLHVRMADEAVRIGPAPAVDSYLRVDRVLEAARATGAEAVHPGYGFLSENAQFAAECGHAGLKFIGPPPRAMELMGSKTRSREAMKAAGVPVVPGTTEPVEGPGEAVAIAESVGYPIMLKASAGGGGKGMRKVLSAGELPSALERAQSEAAAAFADSDVYIEKWIEKPRHIEVQILADEHGRVLHLNERECSLQRRHQKVVEETPSPLVGRHAEVRGQITAAAVRAAEAVGYTNAGTVEFLMDAGRSFYFLEMNTRLQVEHPVTELVTGLDLVREQIRIAAGEPLDFRQEEIDARGCAIECRIYAEDPAANFMPSPGRISSLREPQGPGVRVDSCAFLGWSVPVEYDSLIAKLVVWAPQRSEAIGRLRAALDEYRVGGIRTTLSFFRSIVDDPDFQRGELDTGYIDRWLARDHPAAETDGGGEVAALVAGLHFEEAARSPSPHNNWVSNSRWKDHGRGQLLR